MNTLEWLQSPGMSLKEGDNQTVLQELARLVGMNGGLSWKGFGVMSNGGPLGRLGLAMEEAIRLVFLSGVLEGLTKAEDGAHTKEVTQAIKDEIKRQSDAMTVKIVGRDGQPLDR